MSAALALRPSTALEDLIGRVISAASRGGSDVSRRVAEALAPDLADPALLAGVHCPACPDRYVRHLLYVCPRGAFSLMALVWLPGQASPMHAHRAWCALGVHSGALTESYYTPRPDGTAAWASDHGREAGAISFGAPDPNAIHRLANLSDKPAVSIHAYGLPPDRLCSDLNHLYIA